MRIGINARSLAAPQIRGWTRYTVQLLRYLPELGANLILFTDRPLNAALLDLLPPGSFRVVQSPRLRYLAWEQAWLPLACAREHVDILHAPANYGLPLVSPCPTVLTLHDAIDVAFEPSPLPVPLRQRLVTGSFWIARRSAQRIITVSEHAKADIERYFDVAERRISVIHEASDLLERSPSVSDEQGAVEQLGLPPGPFFLYAGGFERRKNVSFLIDAFRLAALQGVTLVLVGSKPNSAIQSKLDIATGSSAEVVTGFISDLALSGLYRRALAFVYPSLYEGFGLQVCEAMSFGCPTLASNVTSLPEVLGDGGVGFSPTDVPALASLLRRVAGEPAYRDELCTRARRRASDFSWRKTAESTYGVYQSCLKERQRAGDGQLG